MTRFPKALPLLLLALLLAPLTATAVPTRYHLDAGASSVGFVFVLNGTPQKGTMPVQSADIVIDPANLAATTVDVSVGVGGARTGLIFATQALIGPDVLDAAQYPSIRFVSDKVRLAQSGRLSGGAEITGQLTMHGQTHPVTLRADLFRAKGSEPTDLSNLQVELKGQVSRSAFGATGYANLVQDTVTLDILAVIHAGG